MIPRLSHGLLEDEHSVWENKHRVKIGQVKKFFIQQRFRNLKKTKKLEIEAFPA